LLLLTDTVYPRIKVTYGGSDSFREPIEIDAEEFIGVKSFKAKGKRITTLSVENVEELEPLRFPEENEQDEAVNGTETQEALDLDEVKSQQDVKDELTGQMHLFD
jgi:topoisomerase-4 subunit A